MGAIMEVGCAWVKVLGSRLISIMGEYGHNGEVALPSGFLLEFERLREFHRICR